MKIKKLWLPLFSVLCFASLSAQEPYLFLNAPRAGEVLTGGQSYPVSWYSGNIQSVNIDYSTDGGSNWTSIANSRATADSGAGINLQIDGDSWIRGIDWGGRLLDGGVDFGRKFFGSELNDYEVRNVRIDFNSSLTTLCGVFRRDKGYAYSGSGEFKGAAYDISDPANERRLNICFVEDSLSGNANLLWDMGWNGERFTENGGREYIYIMNSSYNGGSDYDADNDGTATDVLWTIWPAASDSNRNYLESNFSFTLSNIPNSNNWLVPQQTLNNVLLRVSDAANTAFNVVSGGFNIIYDFEGPQFSNIDIETPRQLGQADTIAVKLTDESEIGAVTLYYRVSGDAFYEQMDMNYIATDDEYVAVIPGDVQNTRGVQLFFEVTDVLGNQSISEVYSIRIALNSLNSSIITHIGADVTDYNLFSIPVEMDDKSIGGFLNTIGLSEVSDFEWYRFYGYENGSDEGFIEYDEQTGFPNVEPGRGFFLLTDDTDVQIRSSSGKTVRTDDEYQISGLASGWNLVGSPFNFPVPFDSIYVWSNSASASLDFDLWEWNAVNGEWIYIDSGNLSPWKGYALHVDGSFNDLSLFIPPMPAVSGGNPKFSIGNNTTDEWMVQIEVRSAKRMRSFNYLGQMKSALDGKDRLDLSAPPYVGESPYFSFKKEKDTALLTDIRESNGYGHTWEFSAAAIRSNEKFQLCFKGITTLNPEWQVYLTDRTSGSVYDLRRENKLEFISNSMEDRFRFIAGTAEYIKGIEQADLLYPDRFALHPNFPNPFNPVTQIAFSLPRAARVKISLVDILGRELQILENKMFEAGTHSTVWNAQTYSSGIYFIKMQSGNFVQLQKAVLMK